MKKLNKKRIISLFTTTLFTANLFNASLVVKADTNDVNISLKPQYNADVVLTVEDSRVNTANFEKDLRAKLNGLGVKDSRIKITGLKAQDVSAQDSFAWSVYDHKGNWGEDNYPNGDGQANPSNNQHIIVKNQGKNIVFYGYGQPGYKDFMFMSNDSNSKKSFSFELNESGVNYHSMEGGGFLFNSKIENGILNGYSILFTQYSVNVYKITNVNANNFHNEASRGMSYYPGVTLLKTYTKVNSTKHIITIETTDKSIDMWDNGNQTIKGQVLDTQYGNGFGPIASYNSHNCNILSYFAFNNLTMQTTNVTKFRDLIRRPEWELASKRFVVNLNDTSDDDFHNASTFGEILTRITNENLHYIGWGTSANKEEANDLIAKNNGNGTFIDNSDYSGSIDKIANYIAEKLKQTSSGSTKILIGQPVDIDVTPSQYKENTANDDFPLGGWKLNHDDKYYENGMGKATFDGQYMDSLNVNLDKPGKYDVTFRDNIVTPQTIYAHRLPIANFDAEVNNSNGTYTVQLTDKSYDEDNLSKADKGIKEVKWQWRELGSTVWNDGQIPQNLEAGKQYLVQLMVKDYDDAWSNPLVKYLSTIANETEKPIANFSLSPEILYSPIVKSVTIDDNSYDPQGRAITEKVWTVMKDGKVVYTGSTPKTDFSDGSQGQYSISLKVKNGDNIWSESFTRVFTFKDIQGEANQANGDVNIGYAPGDNKDSVTKDVILPTTGTNNTLVRWSSDDPTITKYGKVTRPAFFVGDKTVNLTATIYNNGVNSAKKFTVIVKAVPNTAPVIVDGEKKGSINNNMTFSKVDFTANYKDAEGSEEKSITVTSLPITGSLVYDNAPVKINDVIDLSDIEGLIYIPQKDFVGTVDFGYKASDGYDISNPANLTLNIEDKTPPTAEIISIISNNTKDNKYAKAGDEISLSFKVSEVLNEAPKVTILGKEAVVTKISENSYKATYVVQDNDTQGVAAFKITDLKDKYGNEAQEISTTTDHSAVIVDTIAPIVEKVLKGGSYKPGTSPVVNEGTITLDGEPFNSGDKVTKEGDHTIVATDNAGNVTTVNFNIDGTAPIITEVSNNVCYGKPVTPKFNEGTATLDGKPFISGTEVSDEGNHQIIAIDRAGNTSAVSFVIDKTPPLIKEVVENGQYNKDVRPTFNEGTATLDGKPYNSGDIVSAEGKHTIIVTDKAGNTSTVNFIIDKTPPVISGVKDNTAYNKDVVINYNEGTGILDGKHMDNGSTVSTEGTHMITVIDAAGNISTVSFEIDKTPPIITGVEDKKAYNHEVYLSFNEGEATLNGTPFKNGSLVDKEGTYTITVKDKAGNITSKTFTIDKTAPLVSVVKDGETYKEDKIPEFNEGNATLDGKPYVPGTKVTEEGKHVITVKDAAGNTTTVEFTIDKSMPKTLTLLGKVTSSNGSVDNAKVILVAADGKEIAATATDKEGNYKFKDEKIGLYKLIVNKDGLEQNTEVNLQPAKPTDTEKVVDVSISKYRVVITAEPNSIVGDGEDTTTLTVNVIDEYGNPVPGKTVTLKVSSGTLLNGDNVITDKNGNALFTLQSSKVTGNDMLTVTVSAKVNGLDVPVENNAILHFAPGSINGVVVDNTTGLPIEGAIVEVSKDFDNNGIPDFHAKLITGKDGKYKIAIPKGNVQYDLKITKNMNVGNVVKPITFTQKTKAGSVSSEGKENYTSNNTVTGMILMKTPTGTPSFMDSYSNYSVSIVDKNGSLVSGVTGENNLGSDNSDGLFNFEGLEKNKEYYAAVYYNLPDGSKIKVGSTKITVSNDGELKVANCLIDPYGDVTNKETGALISGAHVKLYYANTARNISKGLKPDTLVDLPSVKDFPPADNLNPQFSDKNGKYAWMVFPHTDYYIVATADGFEKYVSETITVEEEIVRYDIPMTPIKTPIKTPTNSSPNKPLDSNNGSTGSTSGDKPVTTNTNNGELVKTGSIIDFNNLMLFGFILIGIGFVVYRRQAVK